MMQKLMDKSDDSNKEIKEVNGKIDEVKTELIETRHDLTSKLITIATNIQSIASSNISPLPINVDDTIDVLLFVSTDSNGHTICDRSNGTCTCIDSIIGHLVTKNKHSFTCYYSIHAIQRKNEWNMIRKLKFAYYKKYTIIENVANGIVLCNNFKNIKRIFENYRNSYFISNLNISDLVNEIRTLHKQWTDFGTSGGSIEDFIVSINKFTIHVNDRKKEIDESGN